MSTFYERAAGLPPGHSSYFESPHRHLDPDLFNGERLHPEVRARLLTMLEDGLNGALNLAGIEHWLHAWLAGSGITFQWEGGEGDLDVLFGVEMAKFVHHNPNFTGIPESGVAEWVNETLKRVVWPETSHTRFGRRTYEVTFYWNPGTDNSIENIKPYAAYDLRSDTWVVEPPELPVDPRVLYPAEWYQAGARDVEAAEQIVRTIRGHQEVLASNDAGSPAARTAGAGLVRARQAARALFDDIHLGRRQAFGEQGHGYADWHNFRWQHAKSTGVVPALRAITEEAKEANSREETRLYGGPIEAADKLVMREMMRYGPRP